MPKKASELSAKQVRDLKESGTHAVGGVSGLLLQIKTPQAKSWILRTKIGSRRCHIGLGGFPDVSLADARERARELKSLIKQGVDPLSEKKASKLALMQAQARAVTFEQVAHQAHAVKAQEFKNYKHSQQWINTLESYAFPILANMPIDDIESADVLAVLKPIWDTKTETASRLRQRIAAVFDHASASGYRTKPNPAAWKGCLEPLLPSPEKLKKRQGRANNHHPALPVNDMQRFIAQLQQRAGAGARALEFTILTAARSGEIRGAKWDEIDLEEKVWRLSAECMKADKPHTVPLSDAAIALLQSIPRQSKYIFPSAKGDELSDATLSATIKRMHEDETSSGGQGFTDSVNGRTATPHGFRSTFKDWTRQKNRFPDEWSELALAHVNSDATRSAYARNELLDERAEMMQSWSDFINGKFSDKNVVPLKKNSSK